jgi:Abortive infection alpha
MWPDLEQLGKLVPKETIGKLYEDLLSGTAKEVGKFGADVAKTARLILAPLQVTAALQDRFVRMVQRIQGRVPESRQIEPPAEVVGPALEHMRYLDESSALWSMYEEVLTKSVDKNQNASIHPSFTHIISQLSRDEAWILYRLRDRPFNVVDELDYDKKENRFHSRVIISSELPKDELYLSDKVELLYSHLESLSLVTWPVERQTPLLNASNVQTGIRRESKMALTEFGRLFVSASIPEKGFQQHAKK